MIPENWDIVELGSLIDYIKGFAFKSDDYQSDGVRIIRVSDTTFDSIKGVNQIYIAHDKAYLYSKWMLKEYDLILSTVGSKPPMYDSMVGKVIIIEKQYDGALLNQNAVLIRAKRRKPYKQILLLNHLRTKRYLRYIELIFRGNANQASITLNDLFHFQLALPHNDVEQQAIATALSDVDALITSLDKLIAKKRDIKQATMQQLFTGKTRLPEFSKEWEVKKLGDIGETITGSTPPTSVKEFWNGDIPWVTPTDINNQKYIYSTEREITSIGLNATRELPQNSVLVTCIASIGKNAILKRRGSSNQQINAIIPSNNYDADFIYYLMEISKDYLLSKAGITATNIISKKVLLEIRFSFPTKAEQQAIATVLSDMDAEIVALEQRRDKTRALKQGMMQELLTGKTRLLS